MELNQIHHLNFLDNKLPDGCADLIMADPPYYNTKGDFDFIWPTFEDYLKDVELWALECRRLLKDNGTLLWYGSHNKIAYAQVIFDKYFYYLNNGVAHFIDRQTNKNRVEDTRRFINSSERWILYAGTADNNTAYLQEIREYLRAEITKAKGKINFKDINEVFGTATNGGGVASAVLSLNKTEPIMLSQDLYLKLQAWAAPFLSRSYQELKGDFDKYRDELRRPFNPVEKYKLDVLRVSQETHITGRYDHETVKPNTLTRIFINTCTRPGDLVVVPFAGSGTECEMAQKDGRNFIGFDIEGKHVKTARDRVGLGSLKPTLF